MRQSEREWERESEQTNKPAAFLSPCGQKLHENRLLQCGMVRRKGREEQAKGNIASGRAETEKKNIVSIQLKLKLHDCKQSSRTKKTHRRRSLRPYWGQRGLVFYLGGKGVVRRVVAFSIMANWSEKLRQVQRWQYAFRLLLFCWSIPFIPYCTGTQIKRLQMLHILYPSTIEVGQKWVY